MKTLLTLLLSSVFTVTACACATNEVVKPTTKEVCVTTTDAKTKQEVKKCKTIKIHKKYQGTAIPNSNKK